MTKSDLNIYDGKIAYFYFECKKCKERWFSTICYCPKCQKVQKFKILSLEEADEQLMMNMISDRIHYVMLMGGR